jgi:adenylate cyclase
VLPPPRIDVLLVDDQPLVDAMVRRMLASDPSVKLVYCQDPRQAIAMAQQVKPTVILQDLVMPGVDGLDMVSAYRREPLTRDVPLIVLSANEDAEAKVAAFVRGANDYIVKLPDERELVARIRYHSAAYTRMLERDAAYRELEKHSRFIRDVFGRYVSDDVVASLLERPGGLALGGEHREVTVLMADLRGFTTLSERLAPEQVVALLNYFLEEMIDVILAHGGTIDEILGDALLVVFGAPVHHDDHPRRAVACAVEMQQRLDAVNAKNRADGLPAVAMGIGVHTGGVVAGNIGSRRRAKYGVVGPTVNLASRIESYTVGGQILVSASTRDAAGDGLRIDGRIDVTPKGLVEPIPLFEVGGIGERQLPVRDTHPVRLDPPVPVTYTMLEGKHQMSPRFRGDVRSASEVDVEVECERLPRELTDVRIDVDGAGAIYVKVMPYEAAQGGFRGRITSAAPEALALLRRRAVPG